MKKRETNEKLIFSHKGILSSIDMILCCINSATGLGVLKLGAVFTSGLISAIFLLPITCFLSFYSFKLLILAAEPCHQGTFEEIWTSVFSQKTVIIPVLVSVFATLLSIITYIREIELYSITILSKIYLLTTEEHDSVVSSLEKYKMLVGSVVFILFMIPVSFMTHIRTMAVISYVSNVFFVLFMLYLVAMFGYEVKKNGFDPNHSFHFFTIKTNFAKSLSTSIFAYNFHPLTYPGIRHVKNCTRSNLIRIIAISMIIVLVNYIIVGAFSYLTFFDKNKSGVILDYYPEGTKTEKILAIIGRIFSFGFVLLTIPFRLNACRYVILNTITNSSSFPTDIWTFLGLIISLLALCLGNLSSEYLNILFIFSDLLASFQLFIFTPTLYLRANGTKDKFNTFMSIFFLFIGLVTIAFMIVYDGFY